MKMHTNNAHTYYYAFNPTKGQQVTAKIRICIPQLKRKLHCYHDRKTNQLYPFLVCLVMYINETGTLQRWLKSSKTCTKAGAVGVYCYLGLQSCSVEVTEVANCDHTKQHTVPRRGEQKKVKTRKKLGKNCVLGDRMPAHLYGNTNFKETTNKLLGLLEAMLYQIQNQPLPKC